MNPTFPDIRTWLFMLALLLYSGVPLASGIVWSEGFTGREWLQHDNNSLRAIGSTIRMERGKTYAVWIYAPSITTVPFRSNYNNINGSLYISQDSEVSALRSLVAVPLIKGGRKLSVSLPGIGVRVTTRPDLRMDRDLEVKIGFPTPSTMFKVKALCGPYEDSVKIPLRRASISKSRLQAGEEATLKLEAVRQIECENKRLVITTPACFRVYNSRGQSASGSILLWKPGDPVTRTFRVKANPGCRGKVNYKQNILVDFGGEQKKVEVVWSNNPLPTTPQPRASGSITIRRAVPAP